MTEDSVILLDKIECFLEVIICIYLHRQVSQ